jgi:uncharacterized protein
MDGVQLKLNGQQEGAFQITDGGEQMGEMAVSIAEGVLTAHHTEVREEAEGKGYGKKLLAAMTDYARRNNLKVIPLCSYVHLQFRRHPDEYADIWIKQQTDRSER